MGVRISPLLLKYKSKKQLSLPLKVDMNKIKEYVKLSYDELLNKVTWPTWGELQESTIIVMIATLLIAFVIFIMDLISNGGLGFFYQIFK